MWATDSKSLIDALSGDISKAGDHTQLVWRAIERHLNKGTEISAVWVPAHCGIPENEQADKLANAGCRRKFSDHHVRSIPHEVIKSITRARNPVDLVCLQNDDLVKHLPISRRRAEVVLNQLRASCSPLLKTFRTSEKHEPNCTACTMNVADTVEHFIKRCPGRIRERRKNLGRESRLSVEELCTKHPHRILGYINDMGFFTNPDRNFNRSSRFP